MKQRRRAFFHSLAKLSLPAAFVLSLGACAPKQPVRVGPPPGAGPGRPAPRLPLEEIRREPEVRVLLVRAVSAVEIRSNRGFAILDELGRPMASYPSNQRIQLFQHPRAPERLSVYSEVRRGGRRARAERMRLPFGKAVMIQPLKGGTLKLNGQEYRGRLRLIRQGTHFDCVNHVPMEAYLCGVVPHEIGHLQREGMEAMKAQAVASRNYALQRLAVSAGKPYDMVATVFDQVYEGAADEWLLANRAVQSTRGQVLWTPTGPAEVYYSSTCGGATASIDEVWKHDPAGHLISLRDADSRGQSWCRTSKYYRWQQSWSARELGKILRAYLPAAADLPAGTYIGRLVDLNVLSFFPDGRAAVLEVVTDRGRYRVTGDRIRSALKRDLDGNALRSIMFRLKKDYDSQGRLVRVTARGAGWGHGIGLCQVGAINRSKSGQNYAEILSAYFPGTQLKRVWR